MSNLALGTAQFGMKYGVNNKKGKISKEEAFLILDTAIKNGINTIDTAYQYGESEEVIGEYIKKCGANFNIISKLPDHERNNPDYFINSSLKRLYIKEIYAVLIHNFSSFKKKPSIWDSLLDLKRKGKIRKIGFSLYYPIELDYLVKNKVRFDVVQVPFSIFDRRFEKYFPILKEKNIEIQVRSIFLQGLNFTDPKRLPANFDSLRGNLIALKKFSFKSKIPLVAIFLNFVFLNELINKIIVGVDNQNNLVEIIESLDYRNKILEHRGLLTSMRIDDEKVIIPMNWNFSE